MLLFFIHNILSLLYVHFGARLYAIQSLETARVRGKRRDASLIIVLSRFDSRWFVEQWIFNLFFCKYFKVNRTINFLAIQGIVVLRFLLVS